MLVLGTGGLFASLIPPWGRHGKLCVLGLYIQICTLGIYVSLFNFFLEYNLVYSIFGSVS